MPTAVLRWGPLFLALCCLALFGLIATETPPPDVSVDLAFIQSFKILFISLILEAFPFILLGVVFSAALQVFVSDRLIRRLAPKHPVAGALFGSLLGLLFPLCECGMIPVVRRLIRKGMPAYIGIVFIIAGPIVNPVVFASTYTAFRTRPEIAYSRIGLALAVSFTVGLLLYRYMRRDPLKESGGHAADERGAQPGGALPAHAVRGHAAHGQAVRAHDDRGRHAHGAHPPRGGLPSVAGARVGATLSHAADEFFDMGKYLIFGAMLTALIQTAVSRETMAAIGGHEWFSHLFMMGFAFVLSICSTSDAFVAASFGGTFGAGSLLAFLVFGPMIDLKNTLMLLAVFRVRVVLALIGLTAALVLAGSLLLDRFYF